MAKERNVIIETPRGYQFHIKDKSSLLNISLTSRKYYTTENGCRNALRRVLKSFYDNFMLV